MSYFFALCLEGIANIVKNVRLVGCLLYWAVGYYFMAVLMTLQAPVDENHSCKVQYENVSCEKLLITWISCGELV